MNKKKKESSAHLRKEEKSPGRRNKAADNRSEEDMGYLNDMDLNSEDEFIYETEYPGESYVGDEYAVAEYEEDAAEPETGREEPVQKKAKKSKKNKEAGDAVCAEPKTKDKSRLRKLKISIICIVSVLVLLFGAAAAGGYYVTKSPNILPNVYVNGVFVGGMLPEDVPAELEKNGWDEKTSEAFRVKLPAGVSFKLDKCSAGAIFTKEAAQKAAYMYGHSDNIFDNLLKFALNHITPVDVSDEYLRINEKYISETVAKGIEKFNAKTADKGYVIDNKNETLELVKGAGQMKIDAEALSTQTVEALENGLNELSYDHIDSQLTAPDFEAMHADLSVEPMDAYYNDDFTVVDEVVGCDFDPAEAVEIWNAAEPAELVEIPLSIDMPGKTGEYLRSLIYRDKLGSMTTSYKGSIPERINNINLATAKIDGVILMPGQVFSYNETVGQRTEEAGFQAAAAYNDGEVVDEIGGGICQVSSTLYSASMYAMLETVNRVNHYFKVGYMDWGMDATVSWPKPDFKFKNNRDYPVQIRAYCDNENETLTVEIWGTNLDGKYVKEITHSRLCVYDDAYPGEVVIGFGVSAYRKVYDADDNFLYEIEEPYGIYYKHKEDIVYPDPPSGDGSAEANIVTG